MEKLSIFPFDLPEHLARQLFTQYVAEHRDELHEKYGEVVYTALNGVIGRHKQMYWRDVQVCAHSRRQITFSVVTDRPEYVEIDAKIALGALDEVIEHRKRALARAEYWRRQKQAEERAIDAIYKELFK